MRLWIWHCANSSHGPLHASWLPPATLRVLCLVRHLSLTCTSRPPFPALFWRQLRPPTIHGRAGPARRGPCQGRVRSHWVCPENVFPNIKPTPRETAKIQTPSDPGAAGAPSPTVGENGAPPRLPAVNAHAYQVSRRLPSPTQHHQHHHQQSPMAHASPPTAAASPQHLAGLPVINGGGDPQARRPDTSRMRSQIACARCRRSKTKCENNGVNSICKSCANSGRDCSYEPPAAPTNSGSVQRRDSSAAGLNGPTEVDVSN